MFSIPTKIVAGVIGGTVVVGGAYIYKKDRDMFPKIDPFKKPNLGVRLATILTPNRFLPKIVDLIICQETIFARPEIISHLSEANRDSMGVYGCLMDDWYAWKLVTEHPICLATVKPNDITIKVLETILEIIKKRDMNLSEIKEEMIIDQPWLIPMIPNVEKLLTARIIDGDGFNTMLIDKLIEKYGKKECNHTPIRARTMKEHKKIVEKFHKPEKYIAVLSTFLPKTEIDELVDISLSMRPCDLIYYPREYHTKERLIKLYTTIHHMHKYASLIATDYYTEDEIKLLPMETPNSLHKSINNFPEEKRAAYTAYLIAHKPKGWLHVLRYDKKFREINQQWADELISKKPVGWLNRLKELDQIVLPAKVFNEVYGNVGRKWILDDKPNEQYNFNIPDGPLKIHRDRFPFVAETCLPGGFHFTFPESVEYWKKQICGRDKCSLYAVEPVDEPDNGVFCENNKCKTVLINVTQRLE